MMSKETAKDKTIRPNCDYADLPELTDGSESSEDELGFENARSHIDSKDESGSTCCSIPDSISESKSAAQTRKPPSGGGSSGDVSGSIQTDPKNANFLDASFRKNLSKAFTVKPGANGPTSGVASAQPTGATGTGSTKKREKSVSEQEPEPKKLSASKQKPRERLITKDSIKKNLEPILQLASTYLKSGTFSKAADKYDEAMGILDNHKQMDVLDEKSMYALVFSYLVSCIECKSFVYLEKAEKRLGMLILFETSQPMFFHLTAYIRARFHVRWNDYDKGLAECERAEQLSSNAAFAFSTLSYPAVGEVIPISQRKTFEEKLKQLLETCKFPPKPDAICRGVDCSHRREIYSSDPKFDGYYTVRCTSGCEIGFHPSCYKTFTRSTGIVKDKEGKSCVTPNCDGILWSGYHIDKDESKREFVLAKIEPLKKGKERAKPMANKTKGHAGKQHGPSGAASGKRKQQVDHEGAVGGIDEQLKHPDESVDADAGATAMATAGDEELVEREAHPLRREDGDEDQHKPVKKKKGKKNRPQPVVVTFETPSGRTSNDSALPADPDENDGIASDRCDPPMNTSWWNNPTPNQAPPPQHTEAIDDALICIRAIVQDKPMKSIPMTHPDLVDLFAVATEVNHIVWQMGGLPTFLQAYGEPYRLTADDQYVYLLEDDSNYQLQRGDKAGAGGGGERTLKEQMDEFSKKPDPAVIAERCRVLADLQNQVAEARQATDDVNREQQLLIEKLSSEKYELEKEMAELKQRMQKSRQEAAGDTKQSKEQMDKVTENIHGLKYKLDTKTNEEEKLKDEVNKFKRMKRTLELAVRREKSCSCATDAAKEEERAKAAEVTYLTAKREFELQKLEQSYREAQMAVAELSCAADGETLDNAANRARLAPAYASYLRQVQEHIAHVGQQYSNQIVQVQRGTPLPNLPSVLIPQLSPPPSLSAPATQPAPNPPGVASAMSSGRQSAVSDHSGSSGQCQYGSEQSGASAASAGKRMPPPGFEKSAMVPSDLKPNTAPISPVNETAAPTSLPVADPDPDPGAAAGGPPQSFVKRTEKMDKLIDEILKKMPNMSRKQVIAGISKFREQNGGTLAGVARDVLIDGIGRILATLFSNENGAGGENKENDECMICFEKLSTAPTLTMTCGHIAHHKCLRHWLNQGNSCPVCYR